MSNRYATGAEGEFQPGSDGKVLRNALGITDPLEMDEAEFALLHTLPRGERPAVTPAGRRDGDAGRARAA